MIATLGLVRWETAWPYLLATFLGGYFIGSIPFGLIFGYMAGVGDVRKIGSGNIGATNVLRSGKRWAALLTLIFDGLKGWFPVVIAGEYFGIQIFPVIAALGAFMGHVFPIWLGFKGGKGIATFIGIAFAFAWPVACLICATWLSVARVFRYSSLGGLSAALLAPVYFLLIGTDLFALAALVLALLIVFTHRANIARLLRGEEPRIGSR